MNYLAYNALLALASPALAAGLAYRLVTGKSRAGWRQRWGNLPDDLARKSAPRIWVHCASVGEVTAATPILRAYRRIRPGDEIVLSVVTPGGFDTASKLGDLLRCVVYAPFDVPWAVRRALRRIQPDVLVVLETELWPNLLHLTAARGAAPILVNGRISDRSFGRYRRARRIFVWALAHFERILTQSEVDARRFEQIGAPADRIEVFGNSKFDQAGDRLSAAEVAALRADLRLPPTGPVWVVGSTREPDEERIVIEAYRLARRRAPDLSMVHAPRHPDRAAEVERLYREAGFSPVRRTALSGVDGPVRELILDTFGELGRVYAVGDVAFIGNSLTPPGGGQNLLQPLAQGTPVVTGPYMQNFRDITAMAQSVGLSYTARTAQELAEQVLTRLDAQSKASVADRAHALIQANSGASARYAEAIAALAGRESGTRT